MDDLSTEDLRSLAFAANLRRAYAAPVDGRVPPAFAALLERLAEARPDPLEGSARTARWLEA